MPYSFFLSRIRKMSPESELNEQYYIFVAIWVIRAKTTFFVTNKLIRAQRKNLRIFCLRRKPANFHHPESFRSAEKTVSLKLQVLWTNLEMVKHLSASPDKIYSDSHEMDGFVCQICCPVKSKDSVQWNARLQDQASLALGGRSPGEV